MVDFLKKVAQQKGILSLYICILFVGIVLTPILFSWTHDRLAFVSSADALDLGLPSICGLGSDVHRCTLDDVSAVCKTDATKCTDQDKVALKIVAGCSPDATLTGTIVGGLYTYGCSDTQTQQSSAAAKIYNATVTSCTGTWSSITNPGACITRALFAGIASFLIWIGVECLTASGLLFEAILKYTVISFQTPMYTSVSAAVNNAWTVFRDISNILIIGFFTFIAISTILGITEYGAKKLLSRVLIVAVLINFSLLFTKLVIDASNFTAYQFYSASISNVDQPDSTVATGATGAAQVQSKGIAGSFIQYLGITGFADSYDLVRNAQESNDSALTGLVIGILAFIFLIATSLVFLYGSFILITRAILFIFLLITSSLAFATYLIPKLADNYGWSKWWDSLFKNAILAPILMMMLWVTLTVAAGIKGAFGNTGTLGKLATDPTAAGNITALLNFVIILGLLFASFKLASKFSSGVGGFNFAAMVPALGLMAGARFAGAVGRQTIGRGSMLVSDRMEKASQNTKRSDFSRQLFDFGAQKTKGIAKRDFNALGGSIGKAIAANSGLSAGTLAGSKVGGFLGGEEAKAKAAAEQARRMTMSKDDHNAANAGAAMDQVRGSASLSKQHEEALADHENKQSQAGDLGAALVKMNERHDQQMKSLQTALVEAERSGGAAGVGAAKLNITRAAAEHKTAIDEQTARIAEANKAVQKAKGNIAEVVNIGTQLAQAKGLITDYDKSAAAHLAGRIAVGSLSNMNILYSDKENARLAHLAEHEVDHQIKQRDLEKSGLLEAFKKHVGTPEPAAPAAPVHVPEPAHTPAPAAPAADHGGGTHH